MWASVYLRSLTILSKLIVAGSRIIVHYLGRTNVTSTELEPSLPQSCTRSRSILSVCLLSFYCRSEHHKCGGCERPTPTRLVELREHRTAQVVSVGAATLLLSSYTTGRSTTKVTSMKSRPLPGLWSSESIALPRLFRSVLLLLYSPPTLQVGAPQKSRV